MQIQENIEYDVIGLLQTVLDTMKSLRHVRNVPHPKSGKLKRMHARFNQRRPDEIRKRIKRGCYNVKI